MVFSAIRFSTLSNLKDKISTHIIRSFTISCLALVALVALSGQAFATTTYYVNCAAHSSSYPTIQAAVTAVEHISGAVVIDVCPGTYAEQVVISPVSPTTSLTLQGLAVATPPPTHDAVVIVPPSPELVTNTTDPRGDVAAQILVQNTTVPVIINNLTVDGTGNNYTAGDIRGILFQDALGTVNHVVAQNQIPGGTLSGAQSGQGIMVETTSSNSAVLTVENSSVQNYNKNGIVARYAGASLTATSNYVQGSGLSAVAAQNGIELAFNGATGTIKSNTVVNNIYYNTAVDGATASDILLYDAGNSGATVSGNTVSESQETIAVVTDTPGTYGNGAIITGNKISGTSIDAIDVCTNSNTVTGNTIFGTAQSGVHFDASCGAGNNNSGSGNTIVGSACAGYLIDGTTGNSTGGSFFTVQVEVATSTSECTAPSAQTRTRTGSKPKP